MPKTNFSNSWFKVHREDAPNHYNQADADAVIHNGTNLDWVCISWLKLDNAFRIHILNTWIIPIFVQTLSQLG